MRSNQAAIDELTWKKFPLLNDGFVCLVDVMGDDQAVVQAARVSYGNDERKWNCDEMGGPPSPHESSEKIQKDLDNHNLSKDRTLIRYLMRHRHTTPLEMAEVKFLIRCPMDMWRQQIRHRTASVNEYSTRYSEAIDSRQTTPPDAWRLQKESNKQGSEGKLTEFPKGVTVSDDRDKEVRGSSHIYTMPISLRDVEPTPGKYLSLREQRLHEMTQEVYEERLRFGIAREQARKDLPLSTYTEAYWKIDLHNLLHFLNLRMDSHAQQEIRQYAETMYCEIVKPLFPLVAEAFEEYRLLAMQLNYLDKEMIRFMMTVATPEGNTKLDKFNTIIKNFSAFKDWRGEKCRERDECKAKLQDLNIL